MSAELNREMTNWKNWRDARTDESDFCLCGMQAPY